MEYPILIFPTHLKLKRNPGPPAMPQFQKPSAARQRERIYDQFHDLQRVIEKCDANLDTSEADLTPDRVIIFEIVGSIGNFIKAAQKAGFEWLGTMHSEMASTDDFPAIKYDPKTKTTSKIEKNITTTLYAMLPTLEGMKKLLQVWDQWNRGETKFEENLAPFKELLSQLIDIRRWGKKERILDGFESYLNEITDGNTDQMVKVEIEIWPFKSKTRREEALKLVEMLITENKGRLLTKPCNIEEACYHAVLAEIPIQCARAIQESDLINLISCDDIQFFGPKAQSLISVPILADKQDILSQDALIKSNNISNLPVVALLDGLPLANHMAFQGRIILDDPDDFQEQYEPGSQFHGTAMASIILNGDLNENINPNRIPIYVRPILIPKTNHRNEIYEEIPDNILFPDLIHRSIRRLFEDPDIRERHDIKVVNLSVCDPRRPFLQWPSATARVLDWLSYEYNVIFIVSAGNTTNSIQLEISPDKFEALQSVEQQKLIMQFQYNQRHHSRILSPAESINSLAVGALNSDKTTLIPNFNPKRVLACEDTISPALYSTFGLGINSSIKPDLMLPGGRCYLQLSPTAISKATLRWVNGTAKVGILTASPGKGEGALNAVAYSYGTSHAAARLSHDAETAFIILKQLQNEHGSEALPDYYFPVLLKALLAHGAELGEMENLLAQRWDIDLKSHGGREELARTLGYGLPDINKTVQCNEMKATLIGFGEMNHDDAHEYSIPVPDELSGRRFSRTLRYTVAALSPINPRSFDYHAYRIEAELIAPSTNGTFGMTRISTAGWHGWRLSEKGMLLHHIWFGNTGTKYPANSELKIKISCKSINKSEGRPLRYGLVASFAIQEEVPSHVLSLISVYSRIVNAIKARIRPAS